MFTNKTGLIIPTRNRPKELNATLDFLSKNNGVKIFFDVKIELITNYIEYLMENNYICIILDKVENKLNLKDKIINKMREMVNVDKKE